MTTIATKLVKDGNSVAIRIPKTVLIMSGLKDNVQMEIERYKIILRPMRTTRADWKERISNVMTSNTMANKADPELDEWNVTTNDGFNKKD